MPIITTKDLPEFERGMLINLTEDSINKIAEAVVSKLNKSMRHGHWEEFHCSVCGEMGWDNEDKYCPNCGAKMDGEEENE